MGLSRRPECSPMGYCCGISVCFFGFVCLSLYRNAPPEVYIDPIFSIEDFTVPALNTVTNKTQNISTISFEIQVQNRNYNKGVYYDSLNITLYYDHIPSFPVANVSVPGFYHHSGYFDKLSLKETVTTIGIPWDTARQEVLHGSIPFHLNLKTSVKYATIKGKSETFSISVEGEVKFNNKGSIVNPGVVLSSASAPVQLVQFEQGVRLA